MFKSLVFTLLSILLMACHAGEQADGILLINHLGYQQNGFKSAVFQSTGEDMPLSFVLLDQKGKEVYSGDFDQGGKIDNWHTGNAYRADFTEFKTCGIYTLKAIVGKNHIMSAPFSISEVPLVSEILPLLTKAFQLQRCIDPYNAKDKALSFYGERNDVVDVSGGWYDASGEKGKYLSHLSFSNFMIPQQLPMMVWNMLEAVDVLRSSEMNMAESVMHDMLVEAAFGADYLVRVQDPEGYFYATIFAGWTKDPEQREICAYEGQDGKRNDRYQAAFREGGGMAIAALARSAAAGIQGEFNSDKYLGAAKKGYAHLKHNNLSYCDDGKENIIDDYCALMAAIELFKATDDETYLYDARNRAESLHLRLSADTNFSNWLRADEAGKRPYFHGAEAGLPLIAMMHYMGIESEPERINQAKDFVNKAITFELTITNEVNNPFGYARQYVKAADEAAPRSAFFLPHQNETAYWWQGENARLASLATAMLKAQHVLSGETQSLARRYAADQINWVLGLNPYDVCMLHGAGRNNPDYKEDGKSMNYLGGICNGITAGFDDETDIAFRPLPYDEDPAQRWRWSEQWLQHGGWMIPAIAYASVWEITLKD
ncbi:MULTISPECIES: glycoside hydrolase family 9 protein [unclassified Carboxylicivirga]|uniref:glycoside hydrolase family 9 protein n=1 Tax=Carboxylicivirga TaxID=1628153 RepID=UPI003D349B13